MDGPNPQEMDIKVFIPAPTFCLQFCKRYSLNGKKKKFPQLEKWNKIENIDYMTLNNIANKKNHLPQVHFVKNNSSLVLNFWKWGETSSTTSLLLIRTSSPSGFRNSSVFTSSGSILCSNEEWFGNQSVFTTARQCISSSDVTRLVATEHVRNKYSLRESIHLKSVIVLIASIYSYCLNKLHFLQSFKPSDFTEKGGFIFNTWITILLQRKHLF